MPNKPIEYFSGSLPVLSSLTGELSDILVDYQCGLTYKAGDAQSFLRALDDLCEDPRRMQAMGANARRLYEERFSAERVYPAMIDHLEKVAAGQLTA